MLALNTSAGGSEAETFARRSIQSGTECAQLVLRQAARVGVPAEPAPQPLVGVLDRAFLPG